MKEKIEHPNPAELEWIEENLRKAEEIIGKEKYEKISLKELDDAFGKWLDTHDPKKEDPNPTINAFGIAFGQHLVNELELKWRVVIDDKGTDIAVHGQPGDVLVFPTNFVAKRYVSRQKNFFCLFYPEMKKDIERLKEYSKQQRNIFDPDYNISDFKNKLISGKCRWLFTIFAIISFILLLLLKFKFTKSETYFPIYIKGHYFWAIIILATILWGVLAFINWRAWIRKQ